ncbi:efflux RND transporter periplasmic adaptor subunit [Mesorhizobium xinjiangense]|uniref:efflux RND transporter periplasmic adaptor subunit n=1 Tax=Mesorhizobium xinjiangense TaxID=2678685 RepID=UPI0012EED84A|nr:efflux RND transporter periplasmic adaptor subunit [Mesorhizobium xinjiangense]
MKVARILIAAFVLAGAAAGGYWYVTRPAAVATVTPTRGEAAAIVYAAGVVEPRTWAKVTSLVRERIVSICGCEGSRIEKGDELARLDDTEAQAVLTELKARHRLAVDDRDRIALLVERNVVNTTQLDRAQSEVNQIEALIAGQAARLENHILRAPSDGVVLRQDAEVGEIAEPGTALYWVGRLRPLIVVAEVNEEDIPRVEVGQTAHLTSDAFPSRTLEAQVDSITPKGDPVSKTYRVKLRLPDDTPLMIGMSVDANIVTRLVEDALLVPSPALRDGKLFVIENGRAARRAVETGIRGTVNTQILSGLGDDARIVSPYPEELADGARVTTETR